MRELLCDGACGLAVALVAAALYAGSLDAELVGFDDHTLVLEDAAYNADPANLVAAFGHNFFDKYYRPLHRATFILDATRGGTDVTVYHRTNLLFHALGTLLVFAALRSLEVPRRTATVLTLVFAVHPVFVSVVAWIPGRDNALVTVFVLGAFVALVRALDSRSAGARAGWLALHAAGFAAGLFTKEMAAVFPVVAFVYLVTCRDEPWRSRRTLGLVALWLGVGIVWAGMRARAMQGAAEWETVGIDAVFRSAPTVLDLMGKLVAPVRLNAFAQLDPLQLALGAAAWLAIAFAARTPGVRPGRILFGVAWFGLFLAPTLVQRTSIYVYGEYRAYWLTFGLLVAAAEVLRARAVAFRSPLSLAVAGVVVVALAARTLVYVPVFDGQLRFWTHIVEADPDSGWGWFHVGRARSRLGEPEPAEAAYLRAAEVGFEQVDVFVDLAALRVSREDWEGAAEAAARALEIEPDNPFAAFNLGLAQRQAGRCRAAIPALERAVAPETRERIELSQLGGPAFLARAYDQLGACYYTERRHADADLAWASAIAADPGHYGPYIKLIGSRLDAGDRRGARKTADALRRQGGAVPENLRKRLGARGPQSDAARRRNTRASGPR